MLKGNNTTEATLMQGWRGHRLRAHHLTGEVALGLH